MAAAEVSGDGEKYSYDTSSLLSLTTGVKYEDPRFYLNLVKKKELPSERPSIPSTKLERLTFYRGYTATQSKTEIVASHHVELNSQWGINCVDICIFVYLIVSHYQVTNKEDFHRTSYKEADFKYDSSFMINPAQDSTAMVISNALMYLFRGLLSVKVKIHCEDLIHTTMPPLSFNEHNWFYQWPMLFQQFFLGDIFSVVYTVFGLVTELCIVTRAILWVYAKGIATWGEIVFLYLWYPIGRLIDDFTFHYGTPPTQLRILSIRLVPFYYMNWNFIMRPIAKWGPRDFSVRQLRKQFDSRYKKKRM
ncbi:unnamed protein product [Spodoptera exigua]|nr:unnamed protein product [Spodoptera exigua]